MNPSYIGRSAWVGFALLILHTAHVTAYLAKPIHFTVLFAPGGESEDGLNFNFNNFLLRINADEGRFFVWIVIPAKAGT